MDLDSLTPVVYGSEQGSSFAMAAASVQERIKVLPNVTVERLQEAVRKGFDQACFCFVLF